MKISGQMKFGSLDPWYVAGYSSYISTELIHFK